MSFVTPRKETRGAAKDKRKHKPTGATPLPDKKKPGSRTVQITDTISVEFTDPEDDEDVVGQVDATKQEEELTPAQLRSQRKGRRDMRRLSDKMEYVKVDPKATPQQPTPSKNAKSIVPNAKPDAATSTSLILPPTQVLEILTKIFAEVEQDDRAMYKVNPDVIREETSQCVKSSLVEKTNAADLKRLLTYGEVLPEAFTSSIIPFLSLEASDVFYDLGCGTGKIVVQVALETTLRDARGIELMLNRVVEGQRALDRLQSTYPEHISTKSISILQGDICHSATQVAMMDATVVFINNVLFPPEVMSAVCDLLKQLKNLKRVVTMKKICERHREGRCRRDGNACVLFNDPPVQAKVAVSWAKHAFAYLYQVR
ncbi:histone methyltransferase [Thraustotheca clavata]|uniref:Histone-lysine N-methyltransferase, H3 lysine-79 specific n=1 Tax=Thraustotheca clavata TaxID=74557 RepID=A0A1W0A4P7_9STRA|nr:histone methyltransferase [Thraustotheca clavata]